MKITGKFSDLLHFRLTKGLLSLAVKGYFVDQGWIQSYKAKEALSADGKPIPWLTYSFLDFLHGRLQSDFKIFEYGAGNSTLYYSTIVQSIVSVEHNKDWYQRVKNQMPQNVTLKHIPLENGTYATALSKEDSKFDLIIIDGRERVKCCKLAIHALSERGVIILDDSERPKYQEAIDFLIAQGFRHIPFSGIAIGAIHYKSTSVFYKSQNCLAI